MCILVGYDGIDLSCGQACFVNAYMRTNVFRKDEPFVCMVQFLPSAESADMILVGTAEFVAIYVVVLFKYCCPLKLRISRTRMRMYM